MYPTVFIVCLQADDLDSLIADSLSGVQAALDGDRKAAPAGDPGRSADQVQPVRKATYFSDETWMFTTFYRFFV